MENKTEGLPLKIYKDIMEIMSRAYKASHKVLEENKKLGIPTPFSLKGKIYYLMPNGEIQLKKR